MPVVLWRLLPALQLSQPVLSRGPLINELAGHRGVSSPKDRSGWILLLFMSVSFILIVFASSSG